MYWNRKNVGNFDLSEWGNPELNPIDASTGLHKPGSNEIDIRRRLHLVVEVLGRCEAVTVNDKAEAPEIPVSEEDLAAEEAEEAERTAV